jgi:hypothetical protein
MERAAGFTHDDNTQAKLDRLDALLAKSFTPPQDAALLAELLSLPNDGRYPTVPRSVPPAASVVRGGDIDYDEARSGCTRTPHGNHPKRNRAPATMVRATQSGTRTR